MNWAAVIPGLIVLVLKVIGSTLFLQYFSEIFPPETFSDPPNATTRSSGTACPILWQFHGGRCYFFSTQEKAWNQSWDTCTQEDASLAVGTSRAKLDFLNSNTKFESYFVGLRYHHSDSKWRWVDGMELSADIAITRRPDFDCATVGFGRTLSPTLCDNAHRWVCEKPAQ
ncbi:C-type lectin domain family 5 member A-like [Tachyglossus aculeatus]|uniref:C-type lectin domain family 5 member A-like n=1 Tax=Tachyglossus aculeatus TaxID=9261 RepID=UPI0018F2927F|nr:C-type lectin domain family 5 member A-like [Tachyglossus aculeatus]